MPSSNQVSFIGLVSSKDYYTLIVLFEKYELGI